MASIGGIVVAQQLIDAGWAALVLVAMAFGSFSGGLAMLGLSGRLHRREAEDEDLDPKELLTATTCNGARSPAENISVGRTGTLWRRNRHFEAELQYV